MQRSKIDIWVGLFVLIGAAAILFLALRSANLLTLNFRPTYDITAEFQNIGSLKPGAPVKSAGVVVGRVGSIVFDDKRFQAVARLAMDKSYAFPKDSSLKILTSGLLGEQYIGIEPGADEENLAAGDNITSTQSAVVLENLIGQFLYSKAAEGPAPAAVEPAVPKKMIHQELLPPQPARHGRGSMIGGGVQRSAAGLVPLLLMLALASGCATVQRPDPSDPLEPLNRTIFDFNEAVDDAVLEPVATAYVDSVPSLVRRGVSNFFNNLRDAWSFVNNLLQVRPTGAADSVLRFGVNTVFGLGGLLDVAGEMQIPRHTQDFGQTLGYWGVPPGPYLVLPFLGPSTLRDSAALPVDYWGDLARRIDPARVRYPVYALRIVDTRANLLRTTALLSDVALDKYSFTRDAYLQLRRASIGGDEPGEGGLRRKRARAQETTGRGSADDDADAGREPDYTQPADGDARSEPDRARSADDAGKAPDYTQPADADDAGKAPDYTQP